jgi:hypothetical protein
VLFKALDCFDQFLADIALLCASALVLELQCTSVIVISSSIPLTSGCVNSLWTLCKLDKVIHGSLVEKVGIGLEFLCRVHLLDFSKRCARLTLDYSENVLLQPSDDGEALIVFLELFDEPQVGNAAVFAVLFAFILDFFAAVIDPNKVFLSNLDLGLDFLSVFCGSITDSLVLVSDGGKISNSLTELSLLCLVNFISTVLCINVSLFEVSEQLQGRVNGIDCTALHVHQ